MADEAYTRTLRNRTYEGGGNGAAEAAAVPSGMDNP